MGHQQFSTRATLGSARYVINAQHTQVSRYQDYFCVCTISMMGLYLLAYDIFEVYDLVGAKKMYYTLSEVGPFLVKSQ